MPREYTHEALGSDNSSEELQEVVWFGFLRVTSPLQYCSLQMMVENLYMFIFITFAVK